MVGGKLKIVGFDGLTVNGANALIYHAELVISLLGITGVSHA